jgi:hypothetical protein
MGGSHNRGETELNPDQCSQQKGGFNADLMRVLQEALDLLA